MRTALKLLSILALASVLWAQPMQTVMPVPDCQIYFNLTAAAPDSAWFDNRQVGCTAWAVAYTEFGFGAVLVTFQHAPDANGTPGAPATFGGSVLTGTNPNITLPQGYMVLRGYYPWLRVTLTGSGAGNNIRGVFYGYKDRTVTAALIGFGGSGVPIFCNNTAAVVLPGIGTTQIVALTAGQTIYVCHLSLSLSAPSNVTLVRGTGAACVVGPANVSGVYTNVTAMALDFVASPLSVGAASNALCITLSAAVTGGGVVTFARF